MCQLHEFGTLQSFLNACLFIFFWTKWNKIFFLGFKSRLLARIENKSVFKTLSSFLAPAAYWFVSPSCITKAAEDLYRLL